MVHEKRIEIRWRDMDALGHVNNAVYLTYLEELRGEWTIRAFEGTENFRNFVLARVAVDFRAEISQDDEEIVGLIWLTRIGTTSLTFRQELRKPDGSLAAEADSVMVMRDLATGRPRPYTPEERAKLERALVASGA